MQMLQPLHFSEKVFKYFMADGDDLLFYFQLHGYFDPFQRLGNFIQGLHRPQHDVAEKFPHEGIECNILVIDLKRDFIFHGIPP